MARKRKKGIDTNQYSLFDVVADSIEEKQAELAQEKVSSEPEPAIRLEIAREPESPVHEEDAEPVRLGINSDGASVYRMPDGSRMASHNLAIMRLVDGDKFSPDELYVQGRHEFLTIQEVAHFRNETNLVVEADNVRQTNRPSGNRQKRPQTGNNSGREIGGIHQPGLFDTGSLGAEPAGGTEGVGGRRPTGIGSEVIPPAAERSQSSDERHGEDAEEPGAERLRDIAGDGDRHEPENYRITESDHLGSGGAKTKYADNIAAIRLLQNLQAGNAEVATPDEKKILVRYVGWGGLPQVFDPKNEQWAKEYQELQGLLPPAEYQAARRSTQDAHYTSETVIRGIYQGLSRIGVKSDTRLQVLEPSAGIGNFIGLAPEELKANFLAVELDPTTSTIARYLYPKAKHLNVGFQNSQLRGAFDVVVGNPPFGNQALFDPDYPELKKFTIHNYFLAKSVDLLREGGVAAFVVSRYFLDSNDPKVREHIAQKADFLGAIRLPDTAFRQNALTDVTADIVFLQKNSGPKLFSQDWVNTDRQEFEDRQNGGIRFGTINSYFIQHPEQIIGKLVFDHGMYAGSLTCAQDPDKPDLGNEIAQRLAALPQDTFVVRENQIEETAQEKRNEKFLESDYFRSLKPGALAVEPMSGKIIFKIASNFGNGTYDYLSVKNDTARTRISGMIGLRDTLRELLNTEKSPQADEMRMAQLRMKLNSQYDSFVKKYGHLNSQTNRGLMRDDPEHPLLESLELKYDKGLSPEAAEKAGVKPRPASAVKAAIFRQRVLKPAEIVEKVDNVNDALVISLRETGKIDFSRMDQLLHQGAESIQKELQEDGLIFLNPMTEAWEIKDSYLTGNVREKLKIAEQYAQNDNRYAANVEALKAVQPAEIEAVDIGIRFGSTWVPSEVFNAFVEHLHDGNGSQDISYFPALGRWQAKVRIWDDAIDSSVYGIPEYPASKIIESLLINRPIKVEKESGEYDENGKPVMVIDQELAAAAMQKADEIKQAFLDWVWTDDDRREMLTKLYNERFNTHIPPHYDGSHVELVGASSDIKLRPHQKDAVWRAIQEGTALFDHVVGAGKTMACIATIMESKRMGFISKPMVVVPNHLLFQWKEEFYKLYPDANVLIADKTDFTKQNRERLFGRIATGDWDAVIVAHSSFKKIDMPADVQQEILEEQVEAVVEAIAAAKEANGSRATIKQLEKQKEKMENRLNALVAAAGKKDKSVDFADLGVDALFVDESHEFKNLAFQTTMNVSGLGNVMGSAKALDMFIKCRYLQREHDGRGVYFMTGTPVSNTIAEVYTLQRYMQYEELKAKGIEHFDAWASTFGQITNAWELDATGVNYKLKSRFAKFQNVPELLSMYRSFADVITKNDLDQQAKEAGQRPYTPPVKDGKPYNDVVERSPDQAEYMESIIYRMEHLPKDPREDNPLKITNDARKAGLDFRLINPEADDFEGSKINVAVERIYKIWEDTAKDRGTQLVFCDLSTPKGSSSIDSKPLPDTALAAKGTDNPAFETDEDDDSGADPTVAADMDALIALSSGKFSVYDDIKKKLMDKGIPANEIAFIHDANTDLRKAKLFSDMNDGRCRILLGSTAKMGAGMNVQQRLVAAHHLDAPWRPSDLEQRNGRIIRQGNMFYEKDPDNFSVEIYNYATKRTYDARMWQTIEYKSAAIEQFRKGDLLQRVIDDVASEAANAAEMKAAASGNPLILMQVQLASDLRKLEALYSQHQRAQHRLRDRLKWLKSTDERLAKAENVYAQNIRLRDENTHHVTDKGKEKIKVELRIGQNVLYVQDNEKMKNHLLDGIKEVTRNSSAKYPFGTYRGFEVSVERYRGIGDNDGFRLALKGAEGQEFRPYNLVYMFDDKLSLAGLFQRMDNFLATGLDEAIKAQREKAAQEKSELQTINSTLGKEFPQKAELELTRENHAAVIRELQKMQENPEYVSNWQPQILEKTEPVTATQTTQEAAPQLPCKLSFGTPEKRTEYTVSNRHNGYELEGHVLRRVYYDNQVGSIGQSLYTDGKWHTTATLPPGAQITVMI